MTRAAAAVVLLALTVLAVIALAAGDARSGDPRAGPVVESFPLVFRSDVRPDVVATTVVDARTGRPIQGAAVRGYVEGIDGRAVVVNALVCSLTTDDFGLAVARIDTKALSASHWIVTAKGYRPFAAYHGYWPPERVDLEPSTPVAVRVLDPWGRAVAGARVEGFSGCPHAPAVIRGVTDVAGVLTFEDGSPEGFSMWVTAEGCSYAVRDLPPVFGDNPDVQVLPPGIVVRGRVRDLDGHPIPGAVVRGVGYPRGPATLTDAEGRFVLKGLSPVKGVRVLHPTLAVEGKTTHVIERIAKDVPLDLTWTLAGLGVPVGQGRLVVRARDPEGAPVGGLHLLVLGADGRGRGAVTDETGVVSLDLPRGEYRVRGDDPFEAYDVVEARAVVAEGGEAFADLALASRPRLQVKGELPGDLGGVILIAADREQSLQEEAAAGRRFAPIWLPADAQAVVRVEDMDGTWAYSLPVGPVADGVRTATLRVPPAHRLRLASGDSLDGSSCLLASREHPRVRRMVNIVHGVISVRRGGRFLLTVEAEDDGPDTVVPLNLPPIASGAVERVIDLAREGKPDETEGEAHLVVTMADGSLAPEMMVSGGEVGAAWSGFRGTWDSPVYVGAPCRVLLRAPGLYPLQVDVTRSGKHEIVFPAAGIDLTTVDAFGATVASAVLVNGVRFEAPEGRLTLRGFPGGEHAVVVQRTSWPPTVNGSVRWRFTLSEDELHSKILTLP